VTRRLLAIALPLALIACGGQAASPSSAASGLFQPGASPTSDQLCQLLTIDDWNAAGLTGAHAPEVDDDGPGNNYANAYCIYKGMPDSTDLLELDVYAHASVDDASTNFATIAQSLPPSSAPSISGIDDGLIDTNIDPGFAVILVRAGKLVIDITLPSSSSAGTQLTSLAQTVLSRALALE
jgi:hypothetical protein